MSSAPDKIIRLRARTNEGPDFFPQYLNMLRGVRKVGMTELPGGFLAIEIGVAGGMSDVAAEEFGRNVIGVLQMLPTVFEVIFEYVYLETEQVIHQVKWAGRDKLEDVMIEQDGVTYIRIDYYLHAMSFEDLGLLDRNMREQIIAFLNGWSQRAQAREAVPRVKAYYDRVEAIRTYLEARGERVSGAEDETQVEEAAPVA